MHEMSILTNVVDTVLAYAAENDATRVTEVSLVVGDLRDVVDELMESCFQFLSRGTIAEGARLTMTKVPLRLQCEDCLLVFGADIRGRKQIACPDCGSNRLKVKSGREFLISSIVVE